MAPHYSFLLCTLLITFSLSFHGTLGIKYIINNLAPNHGGGIKFEKTIGGIPATQKLMTKVNNYIFTLFKQKTPEERRPVDTVTLNIKDFDGGEAVTQGEIINVSAIYLRDYNGPFTLQKEFESLLLHEMTHVFQWTGEWSCPIPVVEGFADYTPMKANMLPPLAAKPGSGDKWDQGYDFTARFLMYCNTLVPDFTPKFNAMMRKVYHVEYFNNLTGKPVEQLWKEYKAKYAGKSDVDEALG